MADDPRSTAKECDLAEPSSYLLDFRAGAEAGKKKVTYGSDISTLAVVGQSLFCASDETGSVERLDFDLKAGFRNRRSYLLEDLFPKLREPKKTNSKSTKPKKKKKKKAEEADIEGMAVDGGYLWITGSHSLKRPIPDEPRSLADFTEIGWDRRRALLGRVPITTGDDRKPGLAKTVKRGGMVRRAAMMAIGSDADDDPLRSMLRDDPCLGPYVGIPSKNTGRPSKENGFDVEGLAVSNGTVVIGLRGPVLGSYAFVVVLSLEENSDGVLVAKRMAGKKQYRLHALHLFGLGIRDLLFDGNRLLVLAGSTQKTESLQRVFAIEDFLNQPEIVPMADVRLLLTLPIASYGDHAEGIAFFGEKPDTRLLVAHDSPSKTRWDAEKDQLTIDAFDL